MQRVLAGEFGQSLGRVCAIRGRMAHTPDTPPGPGRCHQPVMQRRLGGKRWEKLSQRIMSGERETLRVCQLSHYICRDCIRSYVLVSNGEIWGCVPYIGVGIAGRDVHAGGGWNYSADFGRGSGGQAARRAPTWLCVGALAPLRQAKGSELISRFWTAPNCGEA